MRALCASVYTTVGSGSMASSMLHCPIVAAAGPIRRRVACVPALAAARRESLSPTAHATRPSEGWRG